MNCVKFVWIVSNLFKMCQIFLNCVKSVRNVCQICLNCVKSVPTLLLAACRYWELHLFWQPLGFWISHQGSSPSGQHQGLKSEHHYPILSARSGKIKKKLIGESSPIVFFNYYWNLWKKNIIKTELKKNVNRFQSFIKKIQ